MLYATVVLHSTGNPYDSYTILFLPEVPLPARKPIMAENALRV